MVTPTEFPAFPKQPPQNLLLFCVKILLIIIIILLLPQLVESRSKTQRRRINNSYSAARYECESNPTQCGSLIPEERDGCVMDCISSKCKDQIYQDRIWEKGEVDEVRERRFDECAKREIREQEIERRRVAKESQKSKDGAL
mmetsp:Transcript_14118/g.20159  ORF Transcript_14118/g.20159 Transcript_14118/m.20159 type:complete len:142 (+) Transcript_14118:42-467(+)